MTHIREPERVDMEKASHEGWHSRGYLPHFQSRDVLQSVTFRLADSLPSHLLADAVDDLRRRQIADTTLDKGLGACALRDARIASLVEGALLHFDGQRYRVLAWCVMPNHVHVLIEPLGGCTLSSIVQSWKSFTAKKANALLKQDGRFWAPDYFDRYVRDAAHFEALVYYIEHNPVKAGLAKTATEWIWSSARWRLSASSDADAAQSTR
jgi:putative DNA methylase